MPDKKLDPKFKKAWVAALRSGDYIQGKHNLYPVGSGCRTDIDVMCCLGVACDLIDQDGWEAYFSPHIDAGNMLTRMMWHGDWRMIPEPYASLVGLTDRMQTTLAKKNDLGMTYAKIADYIEENY